MSNRLVSFAAVLPAAFALSAAPAAAAQCSPLRLLTSIAMEARDGGTTEVVPVSINGVAEHFLLDTGGSYTQIARDVAKILNLPPQLSNVMFMDVTGNVSQQGVRIAKFTVGAITWDNTMIAIAPDPAFSQTTGMDGVLSSNYFMSNAYDIDLDFGGGLMNYFSSDHCPGRIQYWPAKARAEVPMRVADNQVHVPVTIDGHEFDAIIDTGASQSSMDAGFARSAFGLVPPTDAKQNVAVNGDPTVTAYPHGFSSLSFEGVAVANPSILIMPNRLGKKDRMNDFQTGSHIKRRDDDVARYAVVLGMDVLRHLHLYFAYKENKLYITEAGTTSALAPVLPSP